MKNPITASVWSPYVAGALAGLLAIGAVVLGTFLLDTPTYLGTSTTFVRVAGFVETAIMPEVVKANAYYAKTKIKIDWQMLLVIGIFWGALLSSLLGKTFRFEAVPPIWKERVGGNFLVRAGGAFLGGILVIIGARLAGGCPSGHGLSGMMQLSLSGVLAMIGFMVGGILTAHLLYTGKGGK